MRLAAGTRRGPYKIQSTIGAGGMGVVYRATDTRLERQVAVKILPGELLGNPLAVERFRREARVVASLNHPGICTLHDVGDHEPFLVMELLDGTTLHERVAGRARPPDEVTALGVDLADALDAAHGRGIVHRDLKPTNVIITSRGQVKILDFGVAMLVADHPAPTQQTQAHLTSAGDAVGTLAYMAPEQLRGEAVDARADLFALGAVLYEMASGQAAFGGATSGLTADAVLNRDPAPLRTLNPGLPPRLEEIILKLLEKDRELRYQHAADVRADLKRLQRDTRRQPAAAPAAAPATARAEAASLAVLPFADLSPSRDQQYFCEGMADEIITTLSSLAGLRVASRTSAARCQDKGLDVMETGRRLNVRAILEGSVRSAGNRLRISVQLTNVDDGYQLWAERYDRDMDDVFAVQDEIARAIADTLRARLAGSDTPQPIQRGTDNLEAYNLYLQGRYHWQRRNRWRFRVAMESFVRATELDPNYAAAHAGVADCHTVMAVYAVRPSNELFQPGLAAAERAVALAPALAEATTRSEA